MAKRALSLEHHQLIFHLAVGSIIVMLNRSYLTVGSKKICKLEDSKINRVMWGLFSELEADLKMKSAITDGWEVSLCSLLFALL